MNKNTKGFTLVEIIVVIVIIAILAALVLPALTGYIKEAREKAIMSEARNAFAEVNGVMINPEKSQTSAYFLIHRYLKDPRSGYTIIYKGPKDESVVGPFVGAYHDYAKEEIRKLMGTEPLKFGYRMYFAETTPGEYMAVRMEVFYKNPEYAGRLTEKPDIAFGNSK